MIRGPGGLAEHMAEKLAVPAIVATADLGIAGTTCALTLRLPKPEFDQLHDMATATRRSQHSLLLEALHLLFERHDNSSPAGRRGRLTRLRLDRAARTPVGRLEAPPETGPVASFIEADRALPVEG